MAIMTALFVFICTRIYMLSIPLVTMDIKSMYVCMSQDHLLNAFVH